jgi:hypothetical protein
MNPPAIAQSLHAVYCRETGLEIPLRMGRDRAWHEFLRAGFCEADLVLVIRFLRKGIARGERNQGALRFRKLAMARKALRPREPQREVVRQTETAAGDIVSRIDIEQPSKSAEEVAALAKQEAEKFRRQMGR